VILRLAVLGLLAFMTLPTVVVIAVSFNPTAILSFPPAGLSLRWYENALTYPQFQRAAVNSLMVTGGAGAGKTDAWLTILHAGNSGMCFVDSAELDELHFPILIKERRLVPDTEGAGRTVGAPTGYCEYGPVGNARVEVVYVADGVINNAKGTLGGLDGHPCRNYRRTADGRLHELSNVEDIILEPGETVVSYCTGGGGYGPPHERPAEKVRYDVEERWISKERAYEVYGVVFDERGNVDRQATAQRRRALAAS